jgi:hypothetical protein
LIYLLEKFGRSGGGSGGVSLSLASLARRYRSHLKTSLAKQATALGFNDPRSLVQTLFNERVQKSYGIDLIEDDNNELVLQAPISRLRAQKRANRSPVLQVADDLHEDTLQHTGVVRTRRKDRDTEKDNLYHLQPLSAALRVNQKEDVEAGNIQTGSMHTAVVFDYDATGDAGLPLITLTLNSSPRERLRFGSDTSPKDIIQKPDYILKDLKSGDGPLKGKVVRFTKGGAWIDCGIGRTVGTRPKSDMVRVLGLLKFSEAVVEDAKSSTRFNWSRDGSSGVITTEKDDNWKDILSFDNLDEDDVDLDSDLSSLFSLDDIEEEEGEVEDITHLFKTQTDGSVTYTDPDTGEVQYISMDLLDDDDDDDDEMDIENLEEDENSLNIFGEADKDDDEEEGPVILNPTSAMGASRFPSSRSKRLHIGDEIDVYVRSVAKQSNQLFFTMRSSIQGKKPKDIKQHSNKEKKLEKLLEQVGGMRRLHELHGREMDGIVKAMSHTGDWLYVEPQEESLPVGIAFGDDATLKGVLKGDKVRIQLEGVDEVRGQLSMKILSKLTA